MQAFENGYNAAIHGASLTISYIAANVLSMLMNFSERSLSDHTEGKIWYPHSGDIVRSSYVDLNEDGDEDDNQPIAGSTTGGPRGPYIQ